MQQGNSFTLSEEILKKKCLFILFQLDIDGLQMPYTH